MEIKQINPKIELVMPDEEKFLKKLIYLKRFEHSPRWHFAMPEMVEIDGLVAFCGFKCWPDVSIQSQKKFFIEIDQKRGMVCGRCAAEYEIAEAELKIQGYI